MNTDTRTVNASPEPPYSKNENARLGAELAMAAVREGKQSITDADALVAKALDARAALEVMSDTWKKSWFEFNRESEDRLRELRMTRMSFDTELRTLVAQLREVRQFFLDKDYNSEIGRLREFVEVCERLQRLKESGFLDSVADTMLKLSQ